MDFSHNSVIDRLVSDPRHRNLGIEATLRGHVPRGAAEPATEGRRAMGAAARYAERIGKFEEDGRPLPRLRHHALWMLHNCVAHPLLAATGRNVPTLAIKFHELTSLWLNHVGAVVRPSGRRRVTSSPVPKVKKTGFWLLHNIVAHAAIGLLPCKATFDLHDWTARAMNVPGWV